jgi:hypothetical protein
MVATGKVIAEILLRMFLKNRHQKFSLLLVRSVSAGINVFYVFQKLC